LRRCCNATVFRRAKYDWTNRRTAPGILCRLATAPRNPGWDELLLDTALAGRAGFPTLDGF
jgi:hypothetical protein